MGYAVQEIDGAAIGKTKELDVVNSLSGKIAGVNITQGGGGLGGGGARVVIRGETSLAGNNGPLFVIDGIPAGSNDVASDDIASVSVLKGPAAAALYGSRAAAGVILITTKSGASGEKNRVGVDVNLSLATQRPFILPDYQKKGIGTLLLNAILTVLHGQHIEEFALDSGYSQAQKVWKKKLGEPTLVLKDHWGEGADHMVWHCKMADLAIEYVV